MPEASATSSLPALIAAALASALAGCAGSQFPGSGDPTQYPIAGLPPPPYSVREDRLPLPDQPQAGSTGYAGSDWQRPTPQSSWPAADAEDPAEGAGASNEMLPPPPTFSSLADCERAYGPGQCRTGDEIYRQYAPQGTSAPPQVAYGYMPHAYGAMTGVLVHGYFGPPGAYVVGVPYQSYLYPPIVSRYRVVTPVVIQRYYAAPVYVRETVIHRGPVIREDRRWAPQPFYPPGRPAPGPAAQPPPRPPLVTPPPPRPAPPTPPAASPPVLRPPPAPPAGSTSLGPPPPAAPRPAPPTPRPPEASGTPPALRPPPAPAAASSPTGPPAPARSSPRDPRNREDGSSR